MPTLPPYAELHCHTSFSFLDGASAADDLAARAAELGLTGLAVTDHQGLYGAVRFVEAVRAAGVRPIVGIEIELRDPAAPDPHGLVVPARRRSGRTRRVPAPPLVDIPVPRDGAAIGRDGAAIGPGGSASAGTGDVPVDGIPARPRPERLRLPGHREPVREDLRGVAERERGPHLVLLARGAVGYRSLCRLVSRANLAGSKGLPRFTHALLEEHAEGLVALSGCRDGEIARRLLAGDREGARAAAERYARIFGTGARGGTGAATSGGAATFGGVGILGAPARPGPPAARARGPSRRRGSCWSSSTTSSRTTTGWWPRPSGSRTRSASRSS